MLSAVWAHRGWTEREAARRYDRLARAARGVVAPFAALLARAADDELRHAELCDRACLALGGTPLADPVDDPGPSDDVLLDVVVTCCLGETLNVVLLHDELATCEPALRAITRQLLADEVIHARLGWRVLEAAAAHGAAGRLGPPIERALADTLGGDPLPPRRAALLDVALTEIIVPAFAFYGIAIELSPASESPAGGSRSGGATRSGHRSPISRARGARGVPAA